MGHIEVKAPLLKEEAERFRKNVLQIKGLQKPSRDAQLITVPKLLRNYDAFDICEQLGLSVSAEVVGEFDESKFLKNWASRLSARRSYQAACGTVRLVCGESLNVFSSSAELHDEILADDVLQLAELNGLFDQKNGVIAPLTSQVREAIHNDRDQNAALLKQGYWLFLSNETAFKVSGLPLEAQLRCRKAIEKGLPRALGVT